MAFTCRAKSCLGCRAAKRRCDRKSPVCTLCEQTGRECLYQQKPRIKFVNQASTRVRRVSDHTSDAALAGPVVAFSPSLTKKSLEDQLRQTFWSIYLPDDNGSSTLATTFKVGSGLAQLRDVEKFQVSAPLAMDACALTILGRRNNDQALLQRGMQSYGKAVSQLQRSVVRLDQESMPSLILACRLLSLYEMMRPGESHLSTQGSDWKKHVRASCSMMELVGGSQCVHGTNRTLYKDINRLAFRINFTSRQHTCLKGDKWRDFQHQDFSSDLQDRLEIAMAALPPLLQQSDRIMQMLRKPIGPKERLTLQTSLPALIDLLIELAKMLRNWEADVLMLHQSETVHSPSSDSSTSTQEDTLFDISRSHGYGFLLAANEYWTTQMVTCCQAQYLIAYSDLLLGVELPTLPDWMQDPWSWMSNIARSASSLLDARAGLWISESSVFPIASCMHTLAGLGGVYSPEMAMMKTAIANATDGAFTTGFLKSMAADSVREDGRGDMDLPEDARRIGSRWYG